MTYKKMLAALCCLLWLAPASVFAGVTAEQAARLGKDLTPVGAEVAANADGSIPAWNPAGPPIPANYVPGSANYTDPYSSEKPIIIIDSNNWEQYSASLTEGTKSMMSKLGPQGFRIEVYPSHRDVDFPDWFKQNTYKNATAASAVEGGQKLVGNLPGVPFPIPQSGIEVMWNHLIRYQTDYSFDYDSYYVSSNGKPILSTSGYFASVYPGFFEENRTQEFGDTPWGKLRINYNAPARRAGEILLVWEPGADYTEGKGRQAWQYLTGQRRVRLAPAVSFDTPNPAVAGTSTYDDTYIFNGSLERYNWTLIGKQELYLPYNTYDFTFQTPIASMLGPRFISPDKVRWEKHRAWVVEATLKEGQRHLYSKRRFYIDEDTWIALSNDNYDGRGNLWRVQYGYDAYLYDKKSFFTGAYGAYDLLQGLYNVNTKPIPGKFNSGVSENEKYFTSKGMARGGVR